MAVPSDAMTKPFELSVCQMILSLKEHQEMERELDYSMLEAAYGELYDEVIPAEMKDRLRKIFAQQDLEELFYDTKEEENLNLQAALEAEKLYDKEVNKDNI